MNLWPIVVRKNSTTLMQRGPRGCTRGEVRSIQDAPQLGLIGRNDASDVAHARGDLGADYFSSDSNTNPAPNCNANADPCLAAYDKGIESVAEENLQLDAEHKKGDIDCEQQSGPGFTACEAALHKKFDPIR